jgi:hypothetical protein
MQNPQKNVVLCPTGIDYLKEKKNIRTRENSTPPTATPHHQLSLHVLGYL